MSQSKPNWPKVSLSTSTYAWDYTYKIVCNTCHKQLATFLLQQEVFLQAWLTKDSFPQRGFMFPQATCFLEHKVVLRLGSHRIFFLTEAFTFPRAHWFSNCGGEWREPSIYISLYVGKDLNMALNQDKRVVLFLLHSTEEVHKKLVIMFWEI